LLSLDEQGRVNMANPAAGVALGKPVVELVGRSLSELLPEEVMRDLSTTPAGAHQRADFQRCGRLYQLHRSFLSQRTSLELGSILLLHDISEERARERQVSSFLSHLCQRLEVPASPRSVRVGLATLRAWSSSGEGTGQGETSGSSADAGALLEAAAGELSSSLPEGRACRLMLEGEGPWRVAASPHDFGLLVDILLDNAVRHGKGDIALGLRRDGGCLELRVEDQGAFAEPAPDGPGLGLRVARRLCSHYQGRLEFSPCDAGTRCVVSLPRGVA
jgi:hypothetical protein